MKMEIKSPIFYQTGEHIMKDLLDLAIDIIENSSGIKAVELTLKLSKSSYSVDEIIAVLEELENSDSVNTLVYTLPNMEYREKIIFFPKGTKMLSYS